MVVTTTPHRLTHVEIARTLGLSVSAVSRMRRGERATSVPIMRAISREYDLPLDRLVDAWVDLAEGDPQPWTDLLEAAWGPVSDWTIRAEKE